MVGDAFLPSCTTPPLHPPGLFPSTPPPPVSYHPDMRLIVRALIMASFAWSAGHEHPAMAGTAPRPQKDDSIVTTWACRGRDETLRKTVPVPQLLFVRDGVHDEVWAGADPLEPMHGLLSEARSISDRLAANYRYEWYEEKAARLSTNALVLPHALWHVADQEQMGAVFVHWLGNGQGEVPALHPRPPDHFLAVNRLLHLTWARGGHLPEELHFQVFPAGLPPEGNPFHRKVAAHWWDEPDAFQLQRLREKFISGSVFGGGEDHCR